MLAKKLAAAIVISSAALTLAAGTANAATLDFSFSNVIGNVAGTVTGQIFGLDPDGTSAATDVVVDSYPAGLVVSGSYPTPVDVFTWAGANIGENSFTLSGGNFVSGEFFIAAGNNDQLYLNSFCCAIPDTNYFDIGSGNDRTVWNDNGVGASGITFSPATGVPEPASIALLGAAIAGLGLIRRKLARQPLSGCFTGDAATGSRPFCVAHVWDDASR